MGVPPVVCDGSKLILLTNPRPGSIVYVPFPNGGHQRGDTARNCLMGLGFHVDRVTGVCLWGSQRWRIVSGAHAVVGGNLGYLDDFCEPRPPWLRWVISKIPGKGKR